MPGLPDITHKWAIVNYFMANCQASYPEQPSDPTETLPNSAAIVTTTVRQDLVMLMQFRSTITAVLLTANKKFTLLFYKEHKTTKHQQCHDNCVKRTLTLIIGILMSSIGQYNRKLYYKVLGDVYIIFLRITEHNILERWLCSYYKTLNTMVKALM